MSNSNQRQPAVQAQKIKTSGRNQDIDMMSNELLQKLANIKPQYRVQNLTTLQESNSTNSLKIQVPKERYAHLNSEFYSSFNQLKDDFLEKLNEQLFETKSKQAAINHEQNLIRHYWQLMLKSKLEAIQASICASQKQYSDDLLYEKFKSQIDSLLSRERENSLSLLNQIKINSTAHFKSIWHQESLRNLDIIKNEKENLIRSNAVYEKSFKKEANLIFDLLVIEQKKHTGRILNNLRITSQEWATRSVYENFHKRNVVNQTQLQNELELKKLEIRENIQQQYENEIKSLKNQKELENRQAYEKQLADFKQSLELELQNKKAALESMLKQSHDHQLDEKRTLIAHEKEKIKSEIFAKLDQWKYRRKKELDDSLQSYSDERDLYIENLRRKIAHEFAAEKEAFEKEYYSQKRREIDLTTDHLLQDVKSKYAKDLANEKSRLELECRKKIELEKIEAFESIKRIETSYQKELNHQSKLIESQLSQKVADAVNQYAHNLKAELKRVNRSPSPSPKTLFSLQKSSKGVTPSALKVAPESYTTNYLEDSESSRSTTSSALLTTATADLERDPYLSLESSGANHLPEETLLDDKLLDDNLNLDNLLESDSGIDSHTDDLVQFTPKIETQPSQLDFSTNAEALEFLRKYPSPLITEILMDSLIIDILDLFKYSDSNLREYVMDHIEGPIGEAFRNFNSDPQNSSGDFAEALSKPSKVVIEFIEAIAAEIDHLS